MKKILVPTDLSPKSNQALDIAVQLAKSHRAIIELLNIKVYPVGDVGAYYSLFGASGVNIDDAWNAIIKDAQNDMATLINKYTDVNIIPLIEEAGSHFINSVLEHKADLIIMASEGADGLKEFFRGSNSEEVVRMATCPVLVLKGNNPIFSPKKAVVAVDLKHESFIKKAIENLPLDKADLHFLYVDNGMTSINYAENKEKMTQIINKLNLKNNCYFDIYSAIDIDKGILNYANEIDADLIIMYTHGRTGISHFFKGSIAEDVVNHSPIPVFTYVES